MFFADVMNWAEFGRFIADAALASRRNRLKALESLASLSSKEFKCEEATHARVLRFVHDTQGSAADLLADAVMRNGAPDHWGEILGPEASQGICGSYPFALPNLWQKRQQSRTAPG